MNVNRGLHHLSIVLWCVAALITTGMLVFYANAPEYEVAVLPAVGAAAVAFGSIGYVILFHDDPKNIYPRFNAAAALLALGIAFPLDGWTVAHVAKFSVPLIALLGILPLVLASIVFGTLIGLAKTVGFVFRGFKG